MFSSPIYCRRFLAAALLLIASGPASATSYTWTAISGGSFQANGSWSPSGIPGGSDSVLLNANATYTINYTSTAQTATFADTLGTATLNVTAGHSYLAGTITVGNVSAATANLIVATGTLQGSGINASSSIGGIGVVSGSFGNLTVTGPGNFNGSCDIGVGGTGTFTIQSNATATISNTPFIGSLNGGNGTLTVSSGGNLLAPQALVSGVSGIGNFAVNGGSSATVDAFNAGQNTGSTGTVSVGDGTTAASLSVTNNAAYTVSIGVGLSGTGFLNVNASGTLTGKGNVSFANATGSSGTGTVSGTWNQTTAAMYIGGATNGTAGGTGLLTINNGGALTVSGSAVGVMTYAGHGTLTINTGGTVNTPALYNYGTLNLQGGTLTTGTNAGAGLMNSGTVTASAATDLYGPVQNLAGGQIINSSGGTFIFHSTVAHNGQSINTMAGGRTTFLATVTGTGPYTGVGTVEYDGTFQPGNTPAQVTYAGNLTFGAASALDIVLGGTTAGSLYDQLAVTGNATLAGNLSVALMSGFNPQPGQQFDIMTYGSRGSDFTSFTGLNLGNGETLFPVVTGTTYSLIVTPEPGTLALVAVAACGFAARWRRPTEARAATA